jgi:hypothetical protein
MTHQNGRKRPLFFMFNRIELCVGLVIFFQANGISQFGDLIFFFSVISSELIVQFVTMSFSCELLLYFYFSKRAIVFTKGKSRGLKLLECFFWKELMCCHIYVY